MSELLLFFALPLATIIFSIALQKILRCPFLVAGIIFATFLIVTFAIGDLMLLIATIVYTIIAFVIAYITMIFLRRSDGNFGCHNQNSSSRSSCGCNRR